MAKTARQDMVPAGSPQDPKVVEQTVAIAAAHADEQAEAKALFETRADILADHIEAAAKGTQNGHRALVAALMAAKELGNAAAYVQLFRLARDLDDLMKEAAKAVSAICDEMGKKYLPEAFAAEKITTLTTETGDRSSLSDRTYAAIVAEMRPKAYQWLRDNGYGDLITETVNSSTLSAFAKTLLEENKELPEELFNVTVVTQANLTRGKKK